VSVFPKYTHQGIPGVSCATEDAKEKVNEPLVTPWTLLDYIIENREVKRGESNQTNIATGGGPRG
jgi:hypothetical protein